MPASELAAATTAAAQWAYWTRGAVHIELSVAASECQRILTIPGAARSDLPADTVGYNYHTEDGCNTVYSFTDREPDWGRASVYRHEFGHALGFDHVEDPEAQMFRIAGEWFTSADALECVRISLCEVTK